MIFNFKLNNNQMLALVILALVVFFVFILPIIDNRNKQAVDEIKEKLENTSNKNIYENRCSKQCCKFTQWPLPSELKSKELPDDANYIGNNMSCNFGSGSGCLCVTKDDFNYLANRGSNSSTLSISCSS
jgi:hypothetical protein